MDTALKIKLDWHLDSGGYRLVDNGKYGKGIVGKGGDLRRTRPLAQSDVVFTAFAKVRTEAELLQFVQLYGLLDSVDPRKSELYEGKSLPLTFLGHFEGEKVATHLETASLFRNILDQSARGWRKVPRRLNLALAEKLAEQPLGEITLVGDSKRGFRIVLKATSLMHGMWLQLAQKLSGQAAFHTCEKCGVIFEVGPAAGRRADATFCSDAHRIEFHSAKRSKGPK